MAWPTLTEALLATEVRVLLGEPTARRISDAEIGRWIDEGAGLICKRALAQESTASFSLTANQIAYATATTGMTDCIAVRAVIYTGHATEPTTPGATGKALLKMHPRHFSQFRASTAGEPCEYLWFNNQLYVWPLPSNTYKMTVFYYSMIEDASGVDNVTLTSELGYQYLYYCKWYAFARALMKIGKPEQALQYMSYFDNFIMYHRDSENLHIGVDSADMMSLPDRTEFVG